MKLKLEVKWSILFTLMYLGWMFIEKITGLHNRNIEHHSIYTNLIAIPAFVIYLLALIDKKKHYFNGTMTFKQGFKSGCIITVFVAIIGPIRQYIALKWLIPDFFENSIEHAVSTGNSTFEEASNYFNLKNYILITFFADLFMGVLTSVVAAIFVKTKNKWT